MMKNFSNKILIIFLIFYISTNQSCSQNIPKVSDNIIDKTHQKDTIENPIVFDFQKTVTEKTHILDEYYRLFKPVGIQDFDEITKLKKNLTDSINKYSRNIKNLSDSIKLLLKDKNIEIRDTSNILNAENNDSSLNHLKNEHAKNLVLIENTALKYKNLEALEKYHNDKYKPAIKELQKQSNLLKDEQKFFFKNETYYAFIVDLKEYEVQMYLQDSTQKFFTNIKNLLTYLNSKNKDVLMITNGGMYESNQMPVGLFVSENIEISEIDTSGPGNVNFTMLPNGVFFINEGNAYVETTDSFRIHYLSNNYKPNCATQSGPMLVVNGKHHPYFKNTSKSNKLRSGVGIMPNGNVVFIISENHNTIFFDFATIFKDVFGCNNALFLDGEVSKMYLKNSRPEELGGYFGPMIAIIKKTK